MDNTVSLPIVPKKYRGYLIEYSGGPGAVVTTVREPGNPVTLHEVSPRGSVEYAERAALEWIDARVNYDARKQQEEAYELRARLKREAADTAARAREASYRESAKPPTPPERYGFISCPHNRVKPHMCATPGFFARLFTGVREGDMWRCAECGKARVWKRYGDCAGWAEASLAEWREACAKAADAADDDGDSVVG